MTKNKDTFERSPLGQALFEFGLETSRAQALALLVHQVTMNQREISEAKRRVVERLAASKEAA